MSADEYKPGDLVYVEFTTQRFDTGNATNADSLPAGTLNRNGTDDGAVTVTVANIDTGRYKATFTIPATYVPGDVLNLSIAATVNSVAGKGAIWHRKTGVGIAAQGKATAGGASTITLQTALGADNLTQRAFIVIVAGTGSGQGRNIATYVNSTLVVTVDRAWVTAPDNTSVYAIIFADSDYNATADAMLDRANAIDGKTPRVAIQLIGATTAGKMSGAGSNTEVFVGLDGSTARVSAQVDASGNRTAVTYP